MQTLKTVLLGSSVLVLKQIFLNTAFVPIHPGITEPSSWKNRATHSLILKADSPPLAEQTQRRAVCKIRSFCVLDGDFQLFLECLHLAGKMRFPLLHRKGIETPANTHQFTS